MILGFTGSRAGCKDRQLTMLRILLQVLKGRHEGVSEAHHGCCLGADEEFAALADQLAIRLVGHPSTLTDWTSQEAIRLSAVLLPARAPLNRNGDIVAACDALIACPAGDEERRSGTWSTVRKCRKAGKPIWVIRPDGEVAKEGTL
jgi:hypothetical protein